MKTFYSLPLVALLALIFSSNVLAEPSRMFTQETSAIEAKGSISLDLDYNFASYAGATGLRLGAFDGVVLINSNPETGTNMGFSASSIGFKKMIQDKIAAYGIVSYYADPNNSDTDFAIGATYTATSGTLTYNINPELITNEVPGGANRGAKNTIFVKGSAQFPLTQVKTGKASVIAELALENNNALDSIVNLGLRWAPRKDVTMDFVVYSDRGSPNNIDNNEKGVPGWIKLNIQL